MILTLVGGRVRDTDAVYEGDVVQGVRLLAEQLEWTGEVDSRMASSWKFYQEFNSIIEVSFISGSSVVNDQKLVISMQNYLHIF